MSNVDIESGVNPKADDLDEFEQAGESGVPVEVRNSESAEAPKETLSKHDHKIEPLDVISNDPTETDENGLLDFLVNHSLSLNDEALYGLGFNELSADNAVFNYDLIVQGQAGSKFFSGLSDEFSEPLHTLSIDYDSVSTYSTAQYVPDNNITYSMSSVTSGSGNTSVVTLSYADAAAGVVMQPILGPTVFAYIEHEISTTAKIVIDVYSADLDGDGDLDIVSAENSDKEVIWYENLGNGTFSGEQIISSTADGAWSVLAVDLDGDGDLDILSAEMRDHEVVWYENLGSGSFGSGTVISSTASGTRGIHAADIDGDGDLDVFSAQNLDDEVVWNENLGGGVFGPDQILSSNADGTRSVFTADLDGDGNLDVVSASPNDDKIAWYKNLGSGRFSGEIVISATADGAIEVFSIDMDGDGDMDLISGSYVDNTVAWYENDGDASFTKHIISNTANGAHPVFAIDIDDDGDIDVLSGAYHGDEVLLYENDGNENFTEYVISSTADGINSVYSADVDGDGDLDILSAEALENAVVWYEMLYASADDFVNLVGSDYDDTLHGNDSDNTISGGAGVDTLYGGGGADTFIFEALHAYAENDTIEDFSTAEGDVIDISDLITNGDVDAGNITDYLNFDDSSGTHTVVQVDGAGTGSYSDAFILNGVTGIDEVTLFVNENIIA